METVNLVYNYKGKWVESPSFSYIEGESSKVENIDIDFLSFTHMVKKYRDEFGMSTVTKLFYQQHGLNSRNGMVLIENDAGIHSMIELIKDLSIDDVIHIYPVEDDAKSSTYVETQSSAYTGSEGVVQKDIDCNVSGFGTNLIHDNDPLMSQIMEELINGGICLSEHGHLHLQSDNGRDELIHGELMQDDKGKGVVLTDSDSSTTDTDSDYEEDFYDSQAEANEKKLFSQSHRKVKYDIDDNNPHFLLGMTFHDAREARLAIARYSVAKCTPLKIRPNEQKRLRAKCKADGCPFHLFISKDGDTGALMVKRIDDEHTCLRDSKNNLASYKFLATEFKDTIYKKPKTSIKDLIVDAEKNMKLAVSKTTFKRAKRIVVNELDGSFKREYAYLGAYVAAITKSNPGSTAHLELCENSMKEGRFVFKRVYICFDALKKGWRAGCRPIVGLDGCHLKGQVRGQVLVAVGRDGNEQLFPIAWAVTGAENKDNWMWFLQLLIKDLQIVDHGKNFTIISDMQKGLVHAVIEVLPLAEHRYCARHVYANWSKKWNGGELKKRFWICCWSTYKEEFNDNLKLLGDLSKKAAEDFVAYNPGAFCRAFSQSCSQSDMVDNNMCESYNSIIREARVLPIVSMLTEMRRNSMERLASHKELVKTWTSEWSPTCMKIYQENMDAAFGCMVVFNGSNGYEVGDRDDRHTVFLDKMVCTCRAWELTGIPCSHAICAIKHAKKDPKTYISNWYHKSKYVACYENAIQPMLPKQFMECEKYQELEPPPVMRLSGRPRKNRIRGPQESKKGRTSGKLSRKAVKLCCTICRSEDHNRAKCPNNPKFQDFSKSRSSMHTTRMNRRISGLGIYINEHTGNMIFNPGFQSETLIRQEDAIESQMLILNPDPVVKYPIPNEREIRQEKRAASVSRSSGSRKIAYVGAGAQPIVPTHLPFKPPGLKWKGESSITTRQLQQERDKKRAKKGGDYANLNSC